MFLVILGYYEVLNTIGEFAIFAESRNLNRNQNENGIDE